MSTRWEEVRQTFVWGAGFKSWPWLTFLAFWVACSCPCLQITFYGALEWTARALWKPEITARSLMAGFAFLPSGLPLSCRRTPGVCQPRQRNLHQVRQPPAPKPPPAVQHRAPGLRPQPQLWGTCLRGQGNAVCGSCSTAKPGYSSAGPGYSVQAGTWKEPGGKTGREVCLFQELWYFLSLIFGDLRGSFLSSCEAENVPFLVLFLVLIICHCKITWFFL